MALNKSQEDVLYEIFSRGIQNGGLSLPLGFGKTRTSIEMAKRYKKGRTLVVLTKTLIAGWIDELKKAFPELKYEILHRSFLKDKYESWRPDDDTTVVLTTIDVLKDAYSEHNLESRLIKYRRPMRFGPEIAEYILPGLPMLHGPCSGPAYIYSNKWGCVIIDELQKYTEVTTRKCRSIVAVAAHHRWGLSGTMFDEPKVTRYLGFLLTLHLKGPRELPDMDYFLLTFGGFQQYLVEREDNPSFTVRPKYNEEIVSHTLRREETEIFQKMRLVLKKLSDKVKETKQEGDQAGQKKYSAYLLAMITYVRECLICPLIPITSMYCDMADFQSKSELSQIAIDQFRELDLEGYLSDERNIFSSRFEAALEKVKKHTNERCIVFSCFRSAIDLFTPYVDGVGRQTFTISAGMSIERRREVLHEFEASPNGVLLLPYDIGAEGLNLQCATVVLLLDLWWNSSKIEQAIGRIYRPGQKAKDVFVYLFVSNTGMEEALVEKNTVKAQILGELKKGSMQKDSVSVKGMRVDDIIRMIDLESNTDNMRKMRLKK